MKLLVGFLIGIFLSCVPAWAQEAPRPTWGTYGLEIDNVPGNTSQQNPKIISSSDGNFLTIWEDGRAGSSKIFAQKINQNGARLWNEDGVSVSETRGNQNFAQLIEDGAGGMTVVWQDYRNGSADIFAQRLSAQGSPLWGPEGIAVCKAAAGQFAPEIVSDGADGVIATWHDYRRGTGEDVYAQRISKDGAGLWREDGLPVCEASGTQWYPKICSDGAGGAIITWTDGRVSSADNQIYAQRVDPSGKALWEKDGIPICAAPQNQERPVIMGTEKGAIVAWNDSRSGNPDIYAQKINLEGKLLWKEEGVAITSAPFSQSNPQLSPDGAGGAIVIWIDNREEESAIFSQRITKDGQISWEENGRRLAKSPGKQEAPEMLKLKTLDWIVVWEDSRKGDSFLFAQKINSAGITLWQEGGIPLTFGTRPQEKPSAALSPNGEVVVAWQDRRHGNYDIYSQKLSPEGLPLWSENGLVICDAAGAVVHQNADMIKNGRDEIILVFEDARSGYLNIYTQKINQKGVLMWGKEGVPAAKVKADQTNPQLISDGGGGAIIVWEDYRNPSFPKIFAQRVSSAGNRVWENGSMPLSKIDSRQSHPLMVSDGSGGAIVVWQDERNPLSLKDLYGQRISGSGERLWGKNGAAVCSENGDQVETAMLSDKKHGAFLAWTDFRRGERNPDIYAQRIDSSGKLSWQKEDVLVCGAPDVQRTPQLTEDQEGGIVVAWTDKGGGSYDIYAQRLNPEGQTLWLTDGIPVNQTPRTQQAPQLCPQQVMVWEDYRYGNWDIFAASVSSQGKLAWGEEGVPLVSLPLTQYAPQIACWKNGEVIVAWEDYRSGKQYEIYAQKLSAKGKPSWQENGVMVKSSNGARAPIILSLPEENSFAIVWEDYTGGGKAIFGQRFTVD